MYLTTNTNATFIIRDAIHACETLNALRNFLLTQINELFILEDTQPIIVDPVINAVTQFVHLNYSRPLLSIKEISENVHMSTTYLCTVFKNGTGITINQYLTSYRMDRAKDLLSTSAFSITEITQKVGYADTNYFSKIFKKQIGLSPSEYREKML